MAAEGPNSVAKAVYVLPHPGDVNVASLVTGIGAMAIIVGLARPS